MIFWFHPLAWWLQKKLAALAEDAADDRSILLVGDRHAYAKVLVDIAASLNGHVNRVVWNSVAMARRADVTRRVDSILDSTRPLSTGLSATGWLALAVCLLPLFYGSAAAQLQSRNEDRDANQILLSGLSLTQEQVHDLEERVRLNPDDVESRTKLISYYFQNGKADERMRHVLWITENHPDAAVLDALVGRVDSMDVPGAFEQAKLLWQANEKAHGSDARVLVNAASFYGASDLKHSESLLLRAAEMDSANAQPRLLMLY